jgi:hypothetical protein
VKPTPSRAALRAPTRAEALELEPWLTRADFRRFKWLREAERAVRSRFTSASSSPLTPTSRSRTSTTNMQLLSSPYQQDGVIERMALIRDKLPGVEEIVTRTPPPGAAQVHMLQATGLLWTARRAAGRAMNRLPAEPTWDTSGLRMELVR